ncbi:MAG: PAS domain S-box protein [Ignavibacteria bacterium]|nr:PAS domain S-box protein [Ignavibacteria bacterium]
MLIWVQLSAKAITDESGKTLYYDGFIRDITEQIETEELANKLSTAVKQSPTVIIITDTDGKIEYVNPKFTELTGYTSDEVLGKTPRILKSGYHPPEFYKDLWDTILSGDDFKGEILNNKKDGTSYWEDTMISPIKDEFGKITHFVSLKEDITERKKMLSELIEAKEKAEEAYRLKSGFISAMSHEIRTPLNIIIGYSGVIKDLYHDPNDQQAGTYFNSIERSGMRLIDTITDILDISRLESGNFEITLTPIAHNSIVISVSKQLEVMAAAKNIPIVHDLMKQEPLILADDYCLNGVLMNLINNSIKFSKAGQIQIKTYVEGDYAVCSIKDHGIGMSEEYQKHLFESFSQEEVGTSRSFEGSGLGLALTKRYLELMKGKIEVQSKKGIGTTMKFKIPISDKKN